MSNYKELAGFLIVALLLTSFFSLQETSAAYKPDLSIVRISPCEINTALPKYVPGYTIGVANIGTGASKETKLDVYIRTFDNKTLIKHLKVKPLNPGSGTRISFSLCNKTDGSFKEGYAVVNPTKSLKEIKYTNNARKFSLKEVMLKSDNKTVTEVYQVEGSPITWTGTTLNYTSPLSGQTNINRMYCKINLPEYTRDLVVWNITAPIPGNLHENVTMKAVGGYQQDSGHPTSWNDTSCTFLIDTYYNRLDYAEITVTGQNLESKNVFKEPIQLFKKIYDPWTGTRTYADLTTGLTRNVEESYTGISLENQSYNITDILSNYNVHHSNVVSLKVTGNPKDYYVAGWFITPKGTINNVTALYGYYDKYGNYYGNKENAVLISKGMYGVSKKIKGQTVMGFEINGTNLQGFSSFKSLGFNSWTWQPK